MDLGWRIAVIACLRKKSYSMMDPNKAHAVVRRRMRTCYSIVLLSPVTPVEIETVTARTNLARVRSTAPPTIR
jgi:hypothetical protein